MIIVEGGDGTVDSDDWLRDSWQMPSRKTKRESGVFFTEKRKAKQAGALKKYFRQPEDTKPEQNSLHKNSEFEYFP
ncbi:hypothetical protein TNIN_405051 [Trichonephila inaurata madagascariensis]|uniref:Uncharacterized protein n=1 Tax=Trichonephila inaurata madagascariensis TaxID=2747483 RepID=A0A8X6MM04_9ARAC|nr:hypothetical protein TNIN_405051 [Trichonephila inaurata madagascariensis]